MYLLSDGDAAFFWLDGGGVETDWRERGAATPAILARIHAQIELE